MTPRTALLMALLAGGIAIAIVSVDLAFTLTARLEAKNANGDWVLVAQTPEPDSGRYDGRPFPEPGGCAGPDLRLVVDNDKPFPDRVSVRISYQDPANQRTRTFYTGEWALQAFETRSHEFTVPSDAFPPPDTNNPRPSAYVNLYVGDLFLSTCVTREA